MKQNHLTITKRLGLLTGLLLILLCGRVSAHGGVTIEEDECIIKFGFYKAHFTIYQPKTSRDKEFCEDLPDSGPTVFVMYYLHQSLAEVPVDFRIIRNPTGLGRFTKWSDLEKLRDLESHSVFYQAPRVRPEGVLMVEHEFDKEGDYVGIVTARHPSSDKIYRAVFPFHVGTNAILIYGTLGLCVLVLAFAQSRYRLFSLLVVRIIGRGKNH